MALAVWGLAVGVDTGVNRSHKRCFAEVCTVGTVEQSGNCTIVLCNYLLDCAIVSSSCSTVVNAEEG